MLPILVVLFVVSYCLLTMLVFEQGQTIESQRTLIRAMLQDSTQLAELKGKIAQAEGQQRARNQASPPSNQKNNSGSAAAPGTSDKNAKQPANKPPRSMKQQAPGKPQSDLEDVRRSTRII
jgi:type II secretory pathway component PulC